MIHKAGDQVATLTTDRGGKAKIENLYLGEYFVKEITPPAGYLADENEYDLICDYEGENTAVIERSCTSPEQVVKQPFQIVKAANNGETHMDFFIHRSQKNNRYLTAPPPHKTAHIHAVSVRQGRT